jgi:hypothetical protein
VQTAATSSRWFLALGFFYPEDGGDTFLQNVGFHKIYTSQKTAFFIVTAVKTSNLTKCLYYSSYVVKLLMFLCVYAGVCVAVHKNIS